MSNEIIPYQDIEKMGKAVAESALFGIKTQQQAIALMLVAQALGKHPALAAMEYNIIQGRPAKKADAMLIDFQASGGKVEWHSLTDEKAEATFSHPSGGSLKLDWDINRAKKAGLYEKDGSMYKRYPRQMLRARLVADGVRAVYPAATGGMLSKEEAEDVSTAEISNEKSRVEQIIDAQVEPKEEVKHAEPVKETKSKKTTKEEHKTTPAVNEQPTPKDNITQKTEKDVKGRDINLPDGVLSIIGLIDNTIQSPTGEIECVKISKEPIVNPNNGKASIKYSFLIRKGGVDQRFGTWDAELAKKVMECIDNRRVVKFHYKERKNDKGTIFNDIVSFKEATIDEADKL